MKLIKNYLTSEEIVNVINILLETESPTQREIIKIGLLYQLLVEDCPKLEGCEDYYDLYVAQTDIDFYRDVNNMWELDELIDKELSVDRALVNLITTLEANMKDFKVEDFISQLEQFKGVLENGETV